MASVLCAYLFSESGSKVNLQEVRFEDWLLHRKRTEKAAQALVAALTPIKLSLAQLSVSSDLKRVKFRWHEQEVQTRQLPKLRNDRLLAPRTVT